MNDILEILLGVAACIAALGTIVVNIIKVYKNAKKELDSIPKKIKSEVDTNVEIAKVLECLKEYLNADRVQIYDFHNGGHYANGRSALKTSCTFEVVRSGIHPKQSQMQNIPLSCIPKFVNCLLSNNVLEVKNLEEIKDNMPSTYELKKNQSIKAFYDIVLENKGGEPIGFLAVQYTKNEYCIDEADKKEILKAKFFVEQNLESLNK